jgi:acetyl esterase/lipase
MSSGESLEVPGTRGVTVAADLEARFDRINVAYKTVNNTPIETAIFVPKTLSAEAEAQAVPVLVHIHGGALIVGAFPEPVFLVDWFVNPSYIAPLSSPLTYPLT